MCVHDQLLVLALAMEIGIGYPSSLATVVYFKFQKGNKNYI